MNQSLSNATVNTKWNIINILLSTIRQTLRQTYKDLKPNKINLAYITSIIRVIIKLTLSIVSSGNITSIKSGMPRNTENFIKIEVNQSAQLWVKQVHDSEKPLLIFIECLKEQNPH